MKKCLAFLAVAVLVACFCVFPVSAQGSQDVLVSRTEDVLDNGDSVVIELYESAAQPRTGKNGYKTLTYYNSGGSAIWAVTVNGSFTYNYGVSSTATGASAVVEIFNSNATYIRKSAYTSGNTATATGTVRYNTVSTTRSVSVSCDKYGNLY